MAAAATIDLVDGIVKGELFHKLITFTFRNGNNFLIVAVLLTFRFY